MGDGRTGLAELGGGPVAALVERLRRGPGGDALVLARELRAGGLPPERVVADLLVPAAAEIGRRWERDEWTVADERRATAALHDVLVGLVPTGGTGRAKGHVVVACVEGEWHALPARLLAESLRWRGWTVDFLGASVPAADLGRSLATGEADAVLLSCTMAARLPGAARCIGVAHEVGLPVIAGGAGFGADHRRAARLGADGWALGVEGCERAVSGWRPPLQPTPPMAPEAGELAAGRRTVEAAWGARVDLGEPGAVAGWLEAALPHLLEAVTAAVVVGDERVLSDHVAWLERAAAARAVPADAVHRALEALRAVLPPAQGEARRLLGEVTATTVGSRPPGVAGTVLAMPHAAAGADAAADTAPAGHHDPGHHDPGHHDPGHHDPGHHDPGHHDPGHHQAGHDDPGHHEAGAVLGDVAFLAARACGTPIAAVCVFDGAGRPWRRVVVGSRALEGPGRQAFESWTTARPDPLVVVDAAADPRFDTNPLVVGPPGIRFYAGTALRGARGEALGTLWVMDLVARPDDPVLVRALEALGRRVEAELGRRSPQEPGPDQVAAADAVEDDDELSSEEFRRRLLEAWTTGTPMGGRLLQTSQVARLFDVSPRTVTYWASQGKLEFILTPGGHRRYPVHAVADLLARSQEGVATGLR